MALLDSEVARIKYELGFSLLTVNAEPYIGFTSIFTQVIQPYLSAGTATTSATAVTAASAPTPVALTLASGTDFAAGQRVVIDVDERQEIVTAQSVSGATLTVQLRLAHSGTYPVAIEGGETIIREILSNIRKVKAEMAETFGVGAIKQVDEIQFYQTGRVTAFDNMRGQLMGWRRELSQALSGGQLLNMWERQAAGAQRVSVY